MHRGRRRLGGALLAAGFVAAVWYANKPAPAPAAPTYGGHGVVDQAGYSSNGTLENPSDRDIAQVQRLLDARARAMMTGDRAGFLAVVDTDAKAFLKQQQVVWANTRQLPITNLDFSYEDTVEPDRTLHRPSFLARVEESYQLRGFDDSPVQVEDGFTFVKQGGQWKLAGVSDADGAFGQRDLPVPWEGRAIQSYGDRSYLAVVDRGQLALAHRVVALCHRSRDVGRALLGVTTQRPTVVFATAGNAHGFKQFTGPDAAAVTYGVHDGADRLVSWRMMIDPDHVVQIVDDPIILPHELTHLAMQDYLSSLPPWLSEGSAEYVAWHPHGGLARAEVVRGYHASVAPPPRLPISPSFYLDHVSLHYLEAQALVTWLAEHRGPAAIRALYSGFSSAISSGADPDVAADRVFRRVLHESPAAVTRAAYAGLVAAGHSAGH